MNYWELGVSVSVILSRVGIVNYQKIAIHKFNYIPYSSSIVSKLFRSALFQFDSCIVNINKKFSMMLMYKTRHKNKYVFPFFVFSLLIFVLLEKVQRGRYLCAPGTRLVTIQLCRVKILHQLLSVPDSICCGLKRKPAQKDRPATDLIHTKRN